MAWASILPRNQHDALARSVFGRPEAAAIVLRRVLPTSLLDALDLATLRSIPTATTRPSFGNRCSDLLFDVDLRGRRALPVRVAFEHQSGPDALMPWRSLVYTGEQWGAYVNAQTHPPRTLPFVLPVLLLQPPAHDTPRRLSDILALPADLRESFGRPFEANLYVDDLSGSVLDDPVAEPGMRALVEVTRILLYSYRNDDPGTVQRLLTLGPLFDDILGHFGPPEVEELLTYVVEVFGARSPVHAIILESFERTTKAMYVTIAEDLVSKGRAEGLSVGRAKALAEAVLGVLEHRHARLPFELRARVLSTRDEPLLQRWFHRALVASTVAEVFHD